MISLFFLCRKLKTLWSGKMSTKVKISMIKHKLHDPFILLVFLFYAQAKPLGIGVKVAHLHIWLTPCFSFWHSRSLCIVRSTRNVVKNLLFHCCTLLFIISYKNLALQNSINRLKHFKQYQYTYSPSNPFKFPWHVKAGRFWNGLG